MTRPLLLLGVPPLLLLGLRAAVGPEIAGYHVDTESCSGLVHDNVTAQRISCAAFLDMLDNHKPSIVGAAAEGLGDAEDNVFHVVACGRVRGSVSRSGDGRWLGMTARAETEAGAGA